jgi:hypothetical protein
LPQRPGYPVPEPQLPKLIRQLGEQVAKGGQIEHAWVLALIDDPSRPRGSGGLPRLIREVTGNGAG